MAVTADKIRLPISNFEVSEYNDDRFKKIKIWVAHTGENLNNTVFELNTLQNMSDSLVHVPIVGYVEKNENEEDDFSDHRQRIIIDNDGIKMEYLGRPYGFIPQENNSKVEYREGKQWLTTEGYLWTKFSNATDIFEKSNGRKSHSMEIEGIDGFVDDVGRLNITQARFSALCILGDEHPPAMAGSTAEFFSANKDFNEEMREMFEEFSGKGANDNLDKELENNLEEDVKTEDEKQEEVIEQAEEKLDLPEEPAEDTEAAEPTEDSSNVETPEEQETQTLTEASDTGNFPADGNDTGDTITADVTAETTTPTPPSTDFEVDKEYVAQLEAENKELRLFKASVEKAEKESVVDTYAKDLGEEDTAKFKADVDNYSDVESLEKDIVFAVFKAGKQNKAEEKPGVVAMASYSLSSNVDEGEFGSLEKYFN